MFIAWKFEKEKFDVILNMKLLNMWKCRIIFRGVVRSFNVNGLMFIATLNKTLKSYLFAIIGAEYIWDGYQLAHEWDKFITPENLKNILSKFKWNIKTDG